MSLEQKLREVSNSFAPNNLGLAAHVFDVLTAVLVTLQEMPAGAGTETEITSFLNLLTTEPRAQALIPYYPRITTPRARFMRDCLAGLVQAGALACGKEIGKEETLNHDLDIGYFDNVSDSMERVKLTNEALIDQEPMRPVFCYDLSALCDCQKSGAGIAGTWAMYCGYVAGSIGGNPIMTDYIGGKRKALCKLNIPINAAPPELEFFASGKISEDVSANMPALDVLSIVKSRPLPRKFLGLIR